MLNSIRFKLIRILYNVNVLFSIDLLNNEDIFIKNLKYFDNKNYPDAMLKDNMKT